ncbi:hypothetical protein HSBAA_04290 [Vreelandella sulfidaeris]|uniref:Uncharacterized protein n=1 Tax=Vreelandella sulfidaeris TaxID=115553 RepID=A0A455U1R8_9GAMM|nr:hypothetical protein HSBAA_04290 [Halomonas sulfidaeris]
MLRTLGGQRRAWRMSANYRVAVRALCDFTAREGDLDHRFTPAPSAREGMQGMPSSLVDAGRLPR